MRIVYKCRMCGKVYYGATAGSYDVVFRTTVAELYGGKKDPMLERIDMHNCYGSKKMLGIADWIGWEE